MTYFLLLLNLEKLVIYLKNIDITIYLFIDQTQIKSEISNLHEEVDQSNAEIDLSHVDIVPDIVEEIKEVNTKIIVEFLE